MRIVIVGNFGLTKKATMAARALPIARELAGRGNDVTVLLPAESPSGKSTTRIDSVRVVSVGPSSPLPLLGHLWLGLDMAWQAVRLRPDVLYVFKPKAYAGLALLLFWLLRPLHLVHAALALDTDDWEGEGGWADRDHRFWWQRRLVTWHERWCLRHADVVTVASRELEKLVSAKQDHVLYAPNAASPSSPGWAPVDGRSVRSALDLGDAPAILAYTRFVEFAPARLVDVLEAVRSRVPTAKLVVVGKGLRGEEREFARLVQERCLSDAVRVVGWVPQHELPAYLAAADVAAYPLDDTLLNRAKCLMKLVDLLLAGVAVVADDVGQAREYIVHGETGYLVRPGDIEAMAERIASLLENRAARQNLGQAARASVLGRWTWAEQATEIAEALEKATFNLSHDDKR
jgi:glycosyltransferase involved in cell wall biosynthesis